MRRDREFTDLSTSTHRPTHDVAFVGGGGVSVALAPDAWLMSSDVVTNADEPDGGHTWRADPALRTTTDVDLANRSATARRAAATRRMHGECWLQPARRPGDVVQIQQADHPDEAGPWLLTSVRHELGWGHTRSVLDGVSAGDTNSLLGSLAGAVGGLL